MTLQTVMFAIMIGVALMLIGAAGIVALRCFNTAPDPQMPPADPQSEMYAAWERYCDALDEAALDGDTARYDRIRALGWRRFSEAA